MIFPVAEVLKPRGFREPRHAGASEIPPGGANSKTETYCK